MNFHSLRLLSLKVHVDYHQMEAQSYEDFRSRVLKETGVAFCTREHFGTPIAGEDRMYIRFAYSGIPVDEIEKGMARLKEFWGSLESVATI